MSSTISAGTTSGTALAVSGDTSGQLVLQTNGTTTAVTIDTSQNVGIGTASPVANYKLTTSQSVDTTAGIYVENTNTGTSCSAATRYKNSGSTVAYTALGGTARASYAGLGANVLAMYNDNVAGISFLVDAAGPITFNTNSTERMRIDSSGNLLFNSGYGSAATAYGCRAWVNFNGTGTVAIRGSANVSSITDNGTGNYTMNFTTAIADANYAISFSAGLDLNAVDSYNNINSFATSSVTIVHMEGNAARDTAILNVLVIR